MNTKVMFSSRYQKWETDSQLIEKIKQFYPIDLDVCASRPNVCDNYYSEEDNGLIQPWNQEFMWMNPVYGRGIVPWAEKVKEWTQTKGAGQSLMILVANRSDTKWWQDMTHGSSCLRCDIHGRLKFGSESYWSEYWGKKRFKAIQDIAEGVPVKKAYKGLSRTGAKKMSAPFPSSILFYGWRGDRVIEGLRKLGKLWVSI